MTTTPGKKFRMRAFFREGLADGVKIKADGCYPPGGFTVGLTAWRELWMPKAVEVQS